ncbi:MAG: glycosyltransferase family 4 protein [Sneathiellales bacterium]|nr:glycosyltransferase family 4 protein [Sneathiellales bacterium]
MKIAFYAPMKSPVHPVPSGDRRVARLLIAALSMAGYEVDLVSSFRSFDKSGDQENQNRIRKAAEQEAKELIKAFLALPAKERPQAWFTYHLYHKAPDWIGPKVATELNIPYLVAEASHAPKQEKGKWATGYAAAAEAIRKADKIFHMTQLDGECLAQIAQKDGQLVYLPPFLEKAEKKSDGFDLSVPKDKRILLSVGMMRGGDKKDSYRLLSRSIKKLEGQDWHLVIVGDGEEREEIESWFEPVSDRVSFLGKLEEKELRQVYRLADLYIWPACGEAYGMAFLEAAREGLPSIAGHIRGVPDVVIDGRTGLLSIGGDSDDFIRKIRYLLDNAPFREQLAQQAREFALHDRSLESAASLLKTHISQVLS